MKIGFILPRGVIPALMLALFVTGCATMPEPLVNQQASASPPSLDSWCQKAPIHFLLVNGMNNYPFGTIQKTGLPNYLGCANYDALYAKLRRDDASIDRKLWTDAENAAITSQFSDFINKLTGSMGYVEDTDESTKQLRGRDFCFLRTPEGYPIGFYYQRKFVDKNKLRQPIFFHGVDWAIEAVKQKEACYGAWNGSSQGRYGEFDPSLTALRDPVNKLLKFNVVDWGLGDAALYLNHSGQLFRWCIAEGVLKMVTSAQPNDRYMIRSHSLGSTIVFDTIQELWHDSQQNAGEPDQLTLDGSSWHETHATEKQKNPFATIFKPFDSTGMARTAFYMFANQYALLSLGRDQDSMQRAANEMNSSTKGPLPGWIQVVAFTDPDDLLSFPVADQGFPYKVANVYLSNNKWKVPGVGTNPLTAHVNYDLNGQVVQIIKGGLYSNAKTLH